MDDKQGRVEALTKYGVARMKFEAEQLEPLLRFGRALADPMRIRILGLLAERSMYGQELAEAVGVQPPTISHHLSLLRAAGLVHVRRENSFHHYELHEGGLREMTALLTAEHLRQIGQSLPAEVAIEPPSEEKDREMTQAAYFKDGRLLDIPKHSRSRRFVMEKLAEAFTWGSIYDEKEVNAILKTFHDDVASLRRELIDQKLMVRESGRYWLARPQLS
jgi:ArsR family transcriptional regulator, arsenate/arsenite/antimonite-responsive transcriptional repressor